VQRVNFTIDTSVILHHINDMNVISKPEEKQKPPRQRMDPKERRAQIMEAARKQIESRGFQNLTVPGIVHSAGVSQGSFYRYFRNVDDVFIALFKETLVPPILEAVENLDLQTVETAQDLEVNLYKWYRALAELISQHSILIREALAVVPYSGGDAAREVTKFLENIRKWGEELLEQVNGSPPFRKVNSRVISHAVLGMVISATVQAAAEGFDVALWAKEMARLEGGGLLSSPWETNEQG
jgi:AcrR family transcriptional regulator